MEKDHYQPSGCDVDGIIKILIIGNSSVGKSCMLARYSEGEFPEGQKATIGIDFKLRQLEVDGRHVKLQIWDTAGQEKFRTITRAYYRGATGVLIIYDVTDEKSFRDVNNWYESVDENTSPGTVVVLCANKCDIKEESTAAEEIENHRNDVSDDDEAAAAAAAAAAGGGGGGEHDDNIEYQPRRVVSAERGRALANEYDIPYFESSAKKNVGVDELFFEISKLCLNQSRTANNLRQKELAKLKLDGKNSRRSGGSHGGSSASCC